MTVRQEQRRGMDRRRQARGGRRDGDTTGYAPMVFVVDQDPRNREIAEAILARLRFAVAPFESMDKAMSVMNALQPEVVVATSEDLDRLRGSRAKGSSDHPVALVPITADHQNGETLVEDIRRVLSPSAARR